MEIVIEGINETGADRILKKFDGVISEARLKFNNDELAIILREDYWKVTTKPCGVHIMNRTELMESFLMTGEFKRIILQ